jgi:hypothetical protein
MRKLEMALLQKNLRLKCIKEYRHGGENKSV